jgi:hypothetical protein
MNKNPFSLLEYVDDHSVVPELSKKQQKKIQVQKNLLATNASLAIPENTDFKSLPKELLAKVFYYLEHWKKNVGLKYAIAFRHILSLLTL